MPATDTIPAPPKGFVLDDEGDVPPPPKGFALDLSPQEASSAMDRVTRPQSPVSAAPSSARYSWKTSPQRSTAEGLVSEEQERRGGMPFEIQPTSGSLDNPHPARAVPAARPNATLSPGAQPSVTMTPFQESGASVGPGAAPNTPDIDTLREKGAEFGRGLGEDVMAGYERLRHPGISVAQGPGGPQLTPTRPLVGPEGDIALAEKEHPNLTGAARAVGASAGGMAADPTTYVFASLPFTEAGPVLSRVISGAFGFSMGASSVAGAQQLSDHWDELTPAQRSEIATQTGLSAAFGAMGTMGAMRGIPSSPYEGLPPEGLPRAEALFRNLVYNHSGASVPPEPTLEQATTAYRAAIQNLHPDVNASHVEDATNLNEAWQTLQRAGRFSPTPPPAPPRQPGEPPLALPGQVPPMHSITQEEIQEIGDKIASLPHEQRPQATLAAHTALSTEMLNQGKFMGPDGQLHQVANKGQADKLAQKFVNEEIGRRDAQAKQSAKEPVPAPPPGFTIEETPGEKKSEAPAFQKGDRVTLPKGDTGTIAHMNSRLIRVSLDSGGKASVPAEQWGKVQKVELQNASQPTGVSIAANVPGESPSAVGVAPGRVRDNVSEPPVATEHPATEPRSNQPVVSGTGAARENVDQGIERTAAADSSKGQIIFARHGETKLDQAGANETVAGWTQEPLDDRGRAAAAKLAENIKSEKPTVIVTSDLARAKQTAEIVGKQLGIPVQEDSRFRPQHVPETEGLKVGAATPIWEGYENNPDKKPEGGESWNEARARQDAALKDVEALVAKGERPVVLTHSRNLEMELGERPKPGEFITRTGREKGGATEPTKGVESGHGKTHLPANDRSDTGSASAAIAPRSGEPAGSAAGPVDHLGQGTGPRDEGRTGGAVSGVQPGALEEKPKPKFSWQKADIVPTEEGGVVAVPHGKEPKVPKDNLAPPPPKGFTIEPEADHEQPQPTTEGRREVPSPESRRGAELARVEPQAGEVPRTKESAEPAPRSSGGERSESPATSRAEGAEPGPGAGVGERAPVSAGGEPAGGRGTRKADGVTPRKNSDWFTHPEDFSVSAGTTQRLAWNLKALNILKKVLAGESKLTDEDRDALAHYVGWGALPHAFRPYDSPYGEQKKWIEAHRQLKDLMTDDEITRARASTINAHFTSPQIVRFMWDAAKRLGFSGGTVLEPSMGSGNFFGMMPKAVRGNSQAIGNELDPTTFNIAKLLYPSASLFNKNFVDLMMPDNSIDMVIGNVPFGEEIFDPHYPKLKARIHDYFLVKSLDKLRPGGVAALISSTGTLDKPNERIREVMANKADLVFALRFPATTFEKTAGTHVTTDLLIFQKRAPGVEGEGEPFKKVVPVEAPHEQDGGMAKDFLNEYFDKHPENMLGKLAISRRMYGSNDLVLLPDKDKPFEEQLNEALDRIPKNLIDDYKSTRLFPGETLNLAPENLIDGNYFLDDKGEVRQKHNGGTLLNPPNVYDKEGKKSPLLVDRATKLVKLRDALTDLMYTMKTVPNDDIGNRIVTEKQKTLMSAYKTYLDKHGLVRSPAASNVFGQDPYYPRLAALEQFNKTTKKTTPAEIFTRRTIFPREQLTATSLSANSKDALFQVLNERGRPDLEFMAQLSGQELPEIAKELQDKGLVYRDPVGGEYKMADDYLSGYVRDKLADAKAAVAQGSTEYQANVEALEKVIPPDKPIERIAVRPGATWIPHEATQEFLGNFLKQPHDVKVSNTGGTWKIDNTRESAENISQYGNAEFSATDLMELALNLKQATSYDLQTYINDEGKPSERRVVNQKRTVAARELQDKLSDQFSRWMKDHREWSPKLARIFNDKYNNLVAPTSDGSHLTFPGANLSVLRDNQFMPHQRNVIWRTIQGGRILLAHVVGAGKTYAMIASGAEMRRLGLAKKILYAVPNHLVEQWARDWLKLYPGANVMVVGKDDFSAKNRQIAMAKMANNDWDAIIMPHSHFNLMDISAERQRKTLEKDLDELEETIRGMEAAQRGYQDRGSSRAMKRSVKQMEKSKANLEAKIASLANLKADKAINFDDTGIDTLFVDEAHEYKNLLFYTKMQRVAGLSQGNAKRATRLKMKTDYLLDRNNGRGVVFATGTPVQNTMAEMYNMIRYVAPDVLEKAGIKYFDDWAANFGKIITAMELSPDAESYKPRSKFAEFTNVQELQRMFNSFADVKTNEDLPQLKALLPKIEGGGPKMITVKNPDIEPIVRSLVRRAAAIRGEGVPVLDDAGKPVLEDYTDPATGKVGKRVKMEYFSKPKPEEDNMLSVVTEGRLAATDPRLLNPSASGRYSKIHDVVKNVVKEYRDGEANKVTQMIFADRFRYTNPATKKEEFNLYHEMRSLLVKEGIPKHEIAIIHDYDNADKKLALFDDVNEGKVRVLLGSTQKMGAGTNAQKRLIAEHHVDFPWKPGELEQRTGRIERQGNTNPLVRLYWYATEHSFDAYMGQTLEGKAKFIWQALAGKDVGDTITDAASDAVLSYEEMKAIASGNPDVKLKMELEAKIRKQEILSEQHGAQARQREGLIDSEEQRIARFKAGKASMEQALANYRAATGEDGKAFNLEILGEKFDDRAKAKEWLEKQETPLSNLHLKLNGLPIIVEPKLVDVKYQKPGESSVQYLEYRLPYPTIYRSWEAKGAEGIEGFSNGTYTAPEPTLASLVHSAESVLRNLPGSIDQIDGAIKFRKDRTAQLQQLAKDEKAFDSKELTAARRDLREVNQRLGIDEFQAALEQEVASDVDASADQGEDEPESGDSVLGRLAKEESGEARPGELAKAVAEAAGTVGNYIREVKHATEIARNLQRGLETLDTQAQADILRGKKTFEELKEKGLTTADDEALYHHLEDPSEVKLDPKQDGFLDDAALPLDEQNTALYQELKDGGVPIENYVHRSVKSKGGMLDRIMRGVKAPAKKGTLSKSAPQTKQRTMMAIESPDGKERRVISIKDSKATMWQDGEPTELGEIKNAAGKANVENETFPEGEPNSVFYDKGKIVEGPDGYDWKITQATTKEIEEHTPVEYYHSAFASLIASNIQLSRAVRALRFVNDFKDSDAFKEITYKGTNPPKGWKSTSLPQFPGYYFEPRTAEVLDDYAQRLQGGDLGILATVQKFLRAAYLINPIVHPLNVAASAAFEKGLSGFAPWKWKTIYKTGNKAIKAVLEKNQDFLDALDAGAALQSHRDAMQEIHKLFFERLAEGLDKKESWAMDAAKALGIEHGNLLNLLHKPSSIAAWVSSDVMYLQAAYQYQAEHSGVSLADAFKEVGRIIPEYRVPSRILDSRLLSKGMTNPLVSWFGAYHYGLLKSFAEAAKAALGAGEPAPGRTKAEEVGKGWDRLAMLGLITMVLFPFVFDKEAKKATGDEHARVRRPGPAGYVDAAEQVLEHKQDASSALQKVFTPSPITKSGVELGFNRDLFSGHQIYDPHADWQTQVDEIGRYLLGNFGQYGQFERTQTSEQKKHFLRQQMGVQMGKTRAEKMAGDIASSKPGSGAESPEDQENRVERREILDQLRKGNSKPFEEAREKHQLTHRQILDLQHRSRLSPLEDTVHGFSIAEVKRVLEAAKADKNQKEIDLLEHVLRQKQARAHSWQTVAAGQ